MKRLRRQCRLFLSSCAVSKSGLNFLWSQKGKKTWGDNESNLALAQAHSLSDVKITNRQENASVGIQSPSGICEKNVIDCPSF